MRIFLIGFMGCGKTTIGRALAKSMKIEWIDLDRHTENRKGKSVTEIFETEGEEAFRMAERDALHSLSDNLIVSCGGGTPCFYDNMERMSENGITLYLHTSIDSLYKRISEESVGRPLVSGKARQEIERLFLFREHTYNKANYIIDTDNKSVEEVEKGIEQILLITYEQDKEELERDPDSHIGYLQYE